jgi:hypothetical protein
MVMRYVIVILLPFVSFLFTAGASAGTGDGLLVGFKGGVNFSVVIPTQRYSVMQSLAGTGSSPAQKEYGPFFRNTGYQYGFAGMIRVRKAFLVSIEPSFSSYVMKYQATSTWYNTSTPTDRIEITTKFTDKLRYFEIPLEIRYELGTGQIRPYLAAGFSFGMLTGALGSAQSSTVQYINNVAINLENNESAGDISGNYITTRLATFPGIGLFVERSRIILFAEADYYISLHNIVNESARYSNQQTVGSSYNVPDNLKLDNLVINIGVLFRINSSLGNQGGGRGKGSAVECPTINRKH